MTRSWAAMLLVILSTTWIGLLAAALMVSRVHIGGHTLTFTANTSSRTNEIYLLDIERALIHQLTRHGDQSHFDVRWSDSGTRLVYGMSDYYLYEEHLYIQTIFGVEQNAARLLTDAGIINTSPSWLPQSRGLIFVSDRDGQSEIYAHDLQTDIARNLTRHGAYDTMPALSPDGRQIAFVSNRDGSGDIFVMNTSGGAAHNITRNFRDDFLPAWSPDGRWIAFISDRTDNMDLYIVTPDGQTLRNLTRSHGDEYLPVWSPDSRSIAFNSDRAGNYEIYVVDVLSGRINNLTNDMATDISPIWSPDSQQIAFLSNRAADAYSIYLVNADGSNLRRVTYGLVLDSLEAWHF